MKKALRARAVVVVAALVLLVGVAAWRSGGQAGLAAQAVPSDSFIAGVVLNKAGHSPEAGVWVIAETESLPTPYRRIVVTNDEGRFLVPDLPKGDYQIWVRGYGLRDSVPVQAAVGAKLSLNVTNARSPQEAAKIYPANYWLSLYEPPSKDELPKEYTSRAHWLGDMKTACITCHQIGADISRLWTRPDDWDEVWKHLEGMSRAADRLGRETLKKSLAQWAARIDAGAVPPAPPRPTGVERNIVLTEWDWGTPEAYIHSTISTDKRNPSQPLYANGKIYGTDFGQDLLWVLDPVKSTVASYPVPTANTRRFGNWPLYNALGTPHHPVLDEKGGLWIDVATRARETKIPWAAQVLSNPSGVTGVTDAGQLMAIYEADHGSNRGYVYFDTHTKRFSIVDTAVGLMHQEMDAEGRLWGSGGGSWMSMFDTKKFDPRNPQESAIAAEKAFLAADAKTGKFAGSGYGITISPLDGTVWRAHIAAAGEMNKLTKFDPKTGVSKDYPLPPPGRGVRGVDATSDGMIWFGAAGSGHLGRFNPKTETFTYWEDPGPKIKGMGPETGTAEFSYYLWIDRFDTLGLGKDTIIANGSNSDSALVFNPVTETFTVIRVPYPRGMFTRQWDGRIDDAKAGWKGRGWWMGQDVDPVSLYTERTRRSFMSHVQLRPDPLAQ